MRDRMQEIEDIMDKNKDVLERLKGEKFSSWDNQDLFYRAKGVLQMGYPVYCIIEINGKSHNGELVNAWQWTAEKVNVKLNDGREIRIPMDSVKHIKSY